MDIYEIDMQLALALKKHTLPFTLSPNLWADISLQETLTWHRVKFGPEFASQVPSNLIGVYSFVVEPDIANHCQAYLLYIGMTAKQNFRTRYRQYLRHQTEERTKRLNVQYMLREWANHLMFYYAPLNDPQVVKSTEDELLKACKPPIPRKYPSAIRQAVLLMDIMGG